MTRRNTHHRLLGATPEWHWFVNRGPHGSSFTWHNEVPRYSALAGLKTYISELAEADPSFPENLRQIALDALDMDSTDLIRRAIQVLAVVGSDSDLDRLRTLADHPVNAVRKDARAALFERGIKRIPGNTN